jgi:hypothetical protein
MKTDTVVYITQRKLKHIIRQAWKIEAISQKKKIFPLKQGSTCSDPVFFWFSLNNFFKHQPIFRMNRMVINCKSLPQLNQVQVFLLVLVLHAMREQYALQTSITLTDFYIQDFFKLGKLDHTIKAKSFITCPKQSYIKWTNYTFITHKPNNRRSDFLI